MGATINRFNEYSFNEAIGSSSRKLKKKTSVGGAVVTRTPQAGTGQPCLTHFTMICWDTPDKNQLAVPT